MSEDRFADFPNGIRLCYRDQGEGDPIVMIIGLGFQLIHWPGALIRVLAKAGHRVIVFDNRDSGRSTFTEGAGPSVIQKLRRQAPAGAYDLGDMAGDVLRLMDYLKIRKAHLVGMSLGGMIAQVAAARHPDRVESLTSVFSTTGARKVGQPNLRMTLQLSKRPTRGREDYVARALQTAGIIGGAGYPADPAESRTLFGEAWDRAGPKLHEGVSRQLGAIFASGDRTAELSRITAPTLVIHGSRDPLVHPSGGAATAGAIPGARHVTVTGMGHEISPAVAPELAGLILGHTKEAVA